MMLTVMLMLMAMVWCKRESVHVHVLNHFACFTATLQLVWTPLMAAFTVPLNASADPQVISLCLEVRTHTHSLFFFLILMRWLIFVHISAVSARRRLDYVSPRLCIICVVMWRLARFLCYFVSQKLKIFCIHILPGSLCIHPHYVPFRHGLRA